MLGTSLDTLFQLGVNGELSLYFSSECRVAAEYEHRGLPTMLARFLHALMVKLWC
jgi:hypothetical protein